VGVEARGNAPRSARAGELLGPHRIVQVGAALAAVALRELEAQEAKLAAAVEQPAREFACLLPLLDVGRDLAPHEAAHRLAQLLVLLAEGRQRRPYARVLDDAQATLNARAANRRRFAVGSAAVRPTSGGSGEEKGRRRSGAASRETQPGGNG
jgi:hypothetical protein